MKNSYCKILLFTALLMATMFTKTVAGPGDTIHIQTFTYGSPQDAWFVFPSDTVRIEKILMKYMLKCNPAQNPACGEWDYLTYTYLYEHTGSMDSTLLFAPSYTVEGNSPDSVRFMLSPSWSFFPVIIRRIHHLSPITLDSTTVGHGNDTMRFPFMTSNKAGRSFFLWKNDELLSAGLHGGGITSLSFYVNNPGSEIKNLRIRMKNSGLDSLCFPFYDTTGFVTLFDQNLTFNASGWNRVEFIDPFTWNDTSGICTEISFTGNTGTDNIILGEQVNLFTPCIYSSGNDHSLSFEGKDLVSVPEQAFTRIDSFITISFWQYGNPLYQPQDQSSFEGLDSLGRRVVNAHIPWSNGNVYWDAGFGNYDRINAAASPGVYEGKWNHWTFTKNAATGTMKIYLNGNLWLGGTGKTKRMNGIKSFNIGSYGNGWGNYDGRLDEFSVWNTELQPDTIREWMWRDITPLHPAYNHLQFYYKFDNESYTRAVDSSQGRINGAMTGPPVPSVIPGSELFRHFGTASERPNVIFGQSTYNSETDTLIMIDSVHKQPVQIIFYNDPQHPLLPDDTLLTWPVYYHHYVYDSRGRAIDSVPVEPDSVIHLRKYPYYSPPFEAVNRFELARYITPYGINLSLGNGFTWVYDVSDYRTLLHDSVHLSAGNWQELLDVKFELIEGTPPRDPLDVKNLWCGAYGYNTGIENSLAARKIKIDTDAVNTRIKMRPTGHGFGGNENCAEFCAKNHMLLVDGTERFRKLVWKDDCGYNPVYPQGGTWVYQRANWCPGDVVPTFDLELTPYVTPGDSVTLDYDVEPYTWNGQGSYPTYVIETQLISYSPPNFILDAAITEIKAPTNADIYRRHNPICKNPVITIKNTGSTPLTSVKITYGVEGAPISETLWTGNLDFMQSVDDTLGAVNWASTTGAFFVTLSEPNHGTDQYPYNNTMHSRYSFTPGYAPDLIFEYKTNNAPEENAYTLKDENGNIILSKSGFSANTTYRDTVHLQTGCYELRVTDSDEDGLTWWANNDGSGWFRIRKVGAGTVKSFNSDFGAEIYHQFTAGYGLSILDYENSGEIEVYPNPTFGIINIDGKGFSDGSVRLQLMDFNGRIAYAGEADFSDGTPVNLNLTSLPSGVYTIIATFRDKVINKKVVILK